jgi:Putative auto-transporter adhesin, head GIN domain
MKSLGYAGILALGLALANSFAVAEVMTRPADGVTRVVFKTPGDLSIRVGAQEKLTVEAEPKVLAQLDISVKGDTLTLSSKGSFKTEKGLKYTLTIKSFRKLRSEGSGNSVIEGFAGNDIDVEAAGSGDIALKDVKPGRLQITIPGSGNVEATGSGKSLLARIDGAGNIDAVNFLAQVVEARLDGSGNIRIHADESLKAAIGGAGNIEYKGKAKVTQSVTGAGSVERL